MYVLDYKLEVKFDVIRDELLSGYLTWLGSYYNNITENKRKLASRAVSCFINNAYPKHNLSRDMVGLTLRESSYTKSLIVNGRDTKRKVSYTYTRSFLTYMVEEGFIELYTGGEPEFEFIYGQWELVGHQISYATILEPLKRLFDTCAPKINKKPKLLTNVIILRNNKKESIPFRMIDEVKEIKQNIQEYNKFTLKYIVQCFLKVYDVQLYKVYNESFKCGGRSFMSESIQSLSGEDRKHVKIDGKRVAIFDYSGYEPSILYSMCQQKFEGTDYYTLDTLKDYDPKVLRNIVKICLLIMFNTNSRESAMTAINIEVSKKFNTEELFKEGKIPRKVIPVSVIVEQIEIKHQVVSEWFYKRFGEMLSNAGSYITDYVICYMQQNYHTLVIPVFDEFIVQEQYREELREVMLEAFEAVLGFNDNCRIKEVC